MIALEDSDSKDELHNFHLLIAVKPNSLKAPATRRLMVRMTSSRDLNLTKNEFAAAHVCSWIVVPCRGGHEENFVYCVVSVQAHILQQCFSSAQQGHIKVLCPSRRGRSRKFDYNSVEAHRVGRTVAHALNTYRNLLLPRPAPGVGI